MRRTRIEEAIPTLRASSGEQLGRISALHVTDDFRHAVLACVDVGMQTEVLVPLLNAQVIDGHPTVEYEVSVVETAPRFAVAHQLSEDELSTILAHFDVSPLVAQVRAHPGGTDSPEHDATDDHGDVDLKLPPDWPEPSIVGGGNKP